MKKSDLLINENISYPSLLDKIYFKKIWIFYKFIKVISKYKQNHIYDFIV